MVVGDETRPVSLDGRKVARLILGVAVVSFLPAGCTPLQPFDSLLGRFVLGCVAGHGVILL
jgi:hypothetical protein